MVRHSALAQTVLFIAGFLLASECGFSADWFPKKTLRVRLRGDVTEFDWNKSLSNKNAPFFGALMEGLVEVDNDYQIIPRLAEKFTLSADGKIYTFFLRKEVFWSDGKKLIAQHFVDSWMRCLTPTEKCTNATLMTEIRGAKAFLAGKATSDTVGLRALDDSRLEVKLEQPAPFFPQLTSHWAFYPIRKEIIQNHKDTWTKPGLLVSIGPYVLESIDYGHVYRARRNPYYYRGTPFFEKVELIVQPDSARALDDLRKGLIDIVPHIEISVPPNRVEPLGKAEKQIWPGLYFIGFNLEKAPTRNPEFRKAISEAIDRMQIAKSLGKDNLIAQGLAPIGVPTFHPSSYWSLDPHSAKARMKLALGNENANKPIKLTVLVPALTEYSEIFSQLKQQLFQNLGIELIKTDPGTASPAETAAQLKTVDMRIDRWIYDYPDPDSMWSYFLHDHSSEKSTYRDTDYRKWVLDARSSQDPGMRERLYLQAEERLLGRDRVAVPLFFYENTIAWAKRIEKPAFRSVSMTEMFSGARPSTEVTP